MFPNGSRWSNWPDLRHPLKCGFGQMTVSRPTERFDVKVAHRRSHVKNSPDLKTRQSIP